MADPIAPDGIDLLRRGAEVDVRTGLARPDLLEIIGGYEALVVRSETKATAEVINAGRRLLVIGRAGVGVDNIDVDAATKRGIVVVNAPTGNTIAAAEHAVALLMAVARRIPQAHAAVAGGSWDRSRFIGNEVRGKTLGLVGLGRIGAEVARRARGLEMQVVGYDPYVPQEYAQQLGVRLVPFELLLGASDFISLHTPLTAATRGMIGTRQLSLCRPSAYLINAARGGLVDEDALAEALAAGRLAGAALDVFAKEPPVDNPLLKSDKVVLTPHLGALTREAQISVALDVAEQVLAVLHGRQARYAVNVAIGQPEAYARLHPYMEVAEKLARLCAQTVVGQLSGVEITYWGEIGEQDTRPLRAAVIKGLLEPVTEEPINLVNAHLVAKSRGLRVVEQTNAGDLESYANLINLRLQTDSGAEEMAGTVIRREPHVVRIGEYWLDLVPAAGNLLFCHHRDAPGIVGRVGTVLGDAGINISSMQVARQRPHGEALMVLGLDEDVPNQVQARLLAETGIVRCRLVRI
ncbi:MAG: phosphoglycerate dehydrogenase [Chloroflexota bacterium]